MRKFLAGVISALAICCLAMVFVHMGHMHPSQPAKFNVATYNIRQGNHGDSIKGNGWGQRLPWITSLIRFHEFDIFGTQEAFRYQLNDMLAELPGYAFIGVAREDGKEEGEHSAIFYRTDLFDVVDSGDFWLSETPEKPGLGWDAACVRICTWGHFRHKPSGKEFLYFNLHMDHVGVVARSESAKLIKQKMKEFGSELPAMLSGDFNVDQESPAYNTIVSDKILFDSYEIADFSYLPNGTFNSYLSDGFSESRIDHIFLTQQFHVTRYGVLTDSYRRKESGVIVDAENAPSEISIEQYSARNPSDHFPVEISVVLQ